ncbi:MAG: ATP-dependent DNA helicase RecG [Muribaculaceae bacterium]|nr:ATP-dependent DNA helicase RecG [Muribaculaceae bacterium]
MLSLRNVDIKFVKGVGPRRADILAKELGIRTAYDLLRHYPTSYVDRSRFYSVRELRGADLEHLPALQIRGRFVSSNVLGEGARMRLVALFSDGTSTLEVTWFKGIKSMRKMLDPEKTYVLFGKVTSFNGKLQMVHPEMEDSAKSMTSQGTRGVYPLTEGLRKANIGSKVLYTIAYNILGEGKETRRLADPLPESVLRSRGLMHISDAIREVHFPTSPEKLQQARFRLKFEELFYIQTDMLMRSQSRKAKSAGLPMPHIGEWFNRFYSTCLPFELTGAQKRVIKEIRADIIGPRQMSRLVQGDVGSGKTLVALMSMLLAIDNGYQAALLAPTEILSTQHYHTIRELAARVGLNVRLLTGSTRARERAEIHRGLEDGSIHILVGTHAILEDKVQFARLGFAVIDEQHRFGVAQRARLWSKGPDGFAPHILVMTATPIPRTLAMTVYGDLDVSVIDELPPGRKPVSTVLRFDQQRTQVYRAMGAQLRQGRQVYIVYPLIEENEKLDLKSLEEGYESICEIFKDYRVAFVHGKMKPAEKDHQMDLFARGDARIMVATTVIEVGVNVPNATTMIIENAERFGLSQLHQLRGRVGRGADKSYCVLMSRYNISGDTRKRLDVMTSTTDGFVIAEADMQFRGPGDIEGTMQSGLPFELKIASLAQDGQIIALARATAEELLSSDPGLRAPQNADLARAIREICKRRADWSQIS